MKDLVIIGAGGLAREITWLIEENNKDNVEYNILGYVTKSSEGDLKYPVLGDDEWLLRYKREICAVCAIADPSLRNKVVDKFRGINNISFPGIISKKADIADDVFLSQGTIICSGCILCVKANVGSFSICDRRTMIGHDSVIDDYVTIHPGSIISGNVHVGTGTLIGSGATVIQGLNIGQESVIGAGATVITDIPANSVSVGVPAKVIKWKE